MAEEPFTGSVMGGCEGGEREIREARPGPKMGNRHRKGALGPEANLGGRVILPFLHSVLLGINRLLDKSGSANI